MRPDIDHYMMQLAKVASTRTTCIKRAVGCVLADAVGRVLSIGYNGVASGMPHCNETSLEPVYQDDPRVKRDARAKNWIFNGVVTAAFSDEWLKVKGNKQCVGHEHVLKHVCQGHDLPAGQDSCEAVHAEQNALIQCRDVSLISTAYVTISPCKPCLKLLINTGCKRIVFAEEHDDQWPRKQWLRLDRKWEKLND